MSESDFYQNNCDILSVYEDAKRNKVIPKVIHRMLLYDSDIPKDVRHYLREFRIHNPEFAHVVWREPDLLSIMNDKEKRIYNGYKYRIQKADYGRYIVMKYFGGTYLDLDLKFLKPLITLYEKYKHNTDVFFEEWVKQENTPHFDIGQYHLMHKPNSQHIQGLLDLCAERHLLKIKDCNDILYTTGPVAISDYFSNAFKINPILVHVPKMEESRYFIHFHAGHWRSQVNG